MPNLGKVDYLFIVNEKVPKENVLEINRHFHGRNRQFIYTESWEEAVIKVADLDARKSFKTAVAVGGDGTVNAVVNGLMKHGNSRTFGVIPAGTGNDFAKSLYLPKTIKENCRLILSTEPKEIDIGKINDVYFANIASIGIDALATKLSANQSGFWKKIHPAVHYALGLLKAILKYRFADFEIVGRSCDDKNVEFVNKKILLAAFANGKKYGGNFPIAPTAKLDDGRLTLCLIERMPFLKILANLPKLLKAKHGELKKVMFTDFEFMRVYASTGLFQADGEIFEEKVSEVRKKSNHCLSQVDWEPVEIIDGKIVKFKKSRFENYFYAIDTIPNALSVIKRSGAEEIARIVSREKPAKSRKIKTRLQTAPYIKN